MPESIIAFLGRFDYESAVRLAVAYGGDADTMAAIADDGIATAYYGKIPYFIMNRCTDILTKDITSVMENFSALRSIE